MFERLAKFRRVVPWLNAPLGEPVRFHPVHSNDNQPGLRHPEGRRLRPHQALACHWFPADGGRLECRWELATAGDQPAEDQGWSPLLASQLVPGDGQTTALKRIAVQPESRRWAAQVHA